MRPGKRMMPSPSACQHQQQMSCIRQGRSKESHKHGSQGGEEGKEQTNEVETYQLIVREIQIPQGRAAPPQHGGSLRAQLLQRPIFPQSRIRESGAMMMMEGTVHIANLIVSQRKSCQRGQGVQDILPKSGQRIIRKEERSELWHTAVDSPVRRPRGQTLPQLWEREERARHHDSTSGTHAKRTGDLLTDPNCAAGHSILAAPPRESER